MCLHITWETLLSHARAQIAVTSQSGLIQFAEGDLPKLLLPLNGALALIDTRRLDVDLFHQEADCCIRRRACVWIDCLPLDLLQVHPVLVLEGGDLVFELCEVRIHLADVAFDAVA